MSTAAACPARFERLLFSTANSVIEPLIKSGWASVKGLPASLIVVEARGRKTGLQRSVPLAALSIGENVLVTTVRGGRSGWIKNLHAADEIRYWLAGRPTLATAAVFAEPGDDEPQLDALPSLPRAIVRALSPYRKWGLAFAVLTPVL